MNEIKASILVVTYNQERYIGDCLQSLVAQKTDFSYEILVGDDASSDSNINIVQKFANAYPDKIIAVLRTKNLGATNNGYDLWRRARGEYIAFCDGDDCWVGETRLQRQVDYLDSHREYSAVCGKSNLIDENGNALPESSIPSKQIFWKFDKSVFTKEDFANWRMPAHDSAILARNPFPEEDGTLLCRAHSVVGDRTFILFFLLHGDIACTENVVSCYRYILKDSHFMTDYETENKRHQDFLMMRQLERYAHSKGWPLSLLKIKQERLIAAACIWLQTPTDFNWKVLKNIICDSESPLKYSFWSLQILCRKWWQLNILKRNTPIQL